MFGKDGLRKTATKKTASPGPASALDRIHEWVLSLPWVTEQPHALAPGVRTFGVECEPLGVRQLWLVTGLGQLGAAARSPISVVLPIDAALAAQAAGWGVFRAPMPANHVLMQAESSTKGADVEALVLTAYGCAMATDGEAGQHE
jgi:hypothetical protein